MRDSKTINQHSFINYLKDLKTFDEVGYKKNYKKKLLAFKQKIISHFTIATINGTHPPLNAHIKDIESIEHIKDDSTNIEKPVLEVLVNLFPSKYKSVKEKPFTFSFYFYHVYVKVSLNVLNMNKLSLEKIETISYKGKVIIY